MLLVDISSNNLRGDGEKLGCTISKDGVSLSMSKSPFRFKEPWFALRDPPCDTKM